jgi:hypothetical protein
MDASAASAVSASLSSKRKARSLKPLPKNTVNKLLDKIREDSQASFSTDFVLPNTPVNKIEIPQIPSSNSQRPSSNSQRPSSNSSPRSPKQALVHMLPPFVLPNTPVNKIELPQRSPSNSQIPPSNSQIPPSNSQIPPSNSQIPLSNSQIPSSNSSPRSPKQALVHMLPPPEYNGTYLGLPKQSPYRKTDYIINQLNKLMDMYAKFLMKLKNHQNVNMFSIAKIIKQIINILPIFLSYLHELVREVDILKLSIKNYINHMIQSLNEFQDQYNHFNNMNYYSEIERRSRYDELIIQVSKELIFRFDVEGTIYYNEKGKAGIPIKVSTTDIFHKLYYLIFNIFSKLSVISTEYIVIVPSKDIIIKSTEYMNVDLDKYETVIPDEDPATFIIPSYYSENIRNYAKYCIEWLRDNNLTILSHIRAVQNNKIAYNNGSLSVSSISKAPARMKDFKVLPVIFYNIENKQLIVERLNFINTKMYELKKVFTEVSPLVQILNLLILIKVLLRMKSYKLYGHRGKIVINEHAKRDIRDAVKTFEKNLQKVKYIDENIKLEDPDHIAKVRLGYGLMRPKEISQTKLVIELDNIVNSMNTYYGRKGLLYDMNRIRRVFTKNEENDFISQAVKESNAISRELNELHKYIQSIKDKIKVNITTKAKKAFNMLMFTNQVPLDTNAKGGGVRRLTYG